jgi:hypothetical protein
MEEEVLTPEVAPIEEAIDPVEDVVAEEEVASEVE